jgi:hypothetical protein
MVIFGNHVVTYVIFMGRHVLMEIGVSSIKPLLKVLFLQQDRTPRIVFVGRTIILPKDRVPYQMKITGFVTIMMGAPPILYVPTRLTTMSSNGYADVIT